jgi:type I restriction enzyme R subunit
MTKYNIVVSTEEATVVAEYTPQSYRAVDYQSEASLERAFIRELVDQGYERLSINNEVDLIANLRKQLEIVNDYKFSDSEWENFFNGKLANKNDGIVEKTIKIQTDYIQNLTRDDGTTKNIRLIDKNNIHNNRLQVLKLDLLLHNNNASSLIRSVLSINIILLFLISLTVT